MYITGGIYKSRKLITLNNRYLRPTSNKVRQSLFNVIIHRFSFYDWNTESNILDAFAGSGIVALEAISRGIKEATLIEEDKDICNQIHYNIDNLLPRKSINIVNDSFFNTNFNQSKFKLFFFDPPFFKNYCNLAIEKVFDEKLYLKDSLIVCETEKDYKFNENLDKYIISKKVYGKIKISFFYNLGSSKKTFNVLKR